jgi:malate dehydrogenase
VAVITNPVNSTVPIVCEVLKHYKVFDPKRVFGVTTLDVVRASRFIADLPQHQKTVDPFALRVTVVGGHSGQTIVPLVSQTGLQFDDAQDTLKSLTNRIQFGGDEVVKAKDGAGSATLSMAYAGARFTNSLLEAMNGKQGIIEPAYVQSDLFLQAEGVAYFSSNVELGPQGVVKVYGLGTISDYEKELLSVALPELKKNIEKGVEFAKQRTANL